MQESAEGFPISAGRTKTEIRQIHFACFRSHSRGHGTEQAGTLVHAGFKIPDLPAKINMRIFLLELLNSLQISPKEISVRVCRWLERLVPERGDVFFYLLHRGNRLFGNE